MISLLRGLELTLRSMGLSVVFREVFRRVFGITYSYNCIPVTSNATFRILRSITLKGYKCYGSGDEVVIQTPFGELSVNIGDINLLGVLSEPLEEMYAFIDVRDAIVVDIGAYISETALLFLSRGAKKVYAFEPVEKHYHYLFRNIARNNVEDKIIPLNYGAWFCNTILNISYEGTGTGSRLGGEGTTIKVRDLSSILKDIFCREKRIDLVKMDCEGCEYSLLKLDCDVIKLSKRYIIEIHGAETPIITKMINCGYKVTPLRKINEWVSIYFFDSS